jgi:hypothetical protein
MECGTWVRKRYSTWQEGVGTSFTNRLNSSGEMSPHWVTPARTTRHVDVTNRKEVWTFGSQDMTIWFSQGKTVSLGRLACEISL